MRLYIPIYKVYTILTCLPPSSTQNRRNQKPSDRYTDVLSLNLTDRTCSLEFSELLAVGRGQYSHLFCAIIQPFWFKNKTKRYHNKPSKQNKPNKPPNNPKSQRHEGRAAVTSNPLWGHMDRSLSS